MNKCPRAATNLMKKYAKNCRPQWLSRLAAFNLILQNEWKQNYLKCEFYHCLASHSHPYPLVLGMEPTLSNYLLKMRVCNPHCQLISLQVRECDRHCTLIDQNEGCNYVIDWSMKNKGHDLTLSICRVSFRWLLPRSANRVLRAVDCHCTSLSVSC